MQYYMQTFTEVSILLCKAHEMVQFRYSEKATKNLKKTLRFALTLISNFKRKWEFFFQICGFFTTFQIYFVLKVVLIYCDRTGT